MLTTSLLVNAQPPPSSSAQIGPSPQESTKPSEAIVKDDELLQGLLELIGEVTETTEASGKKSADILPTDVGLTQEQVDASNMSPLEAIRQSMLIAAGYLKSGSTEADTQRIQLDIVARLDDLISQIESKNSQRRESSEDQEQQDQGSQNQKSREGEQDQPQPQPQVTPGDGDPAEGAGKPTDSDAPDVEGPASNSAVRLAAPRALVQGIWGNLPPNIRQRMQVRMVEAFLPNYEAEIEAYYRQLMDEK